MSLSGRNISLKQVIWETYRDSGIQDQLNWSDITEWATDALQLIDYPDQWQKKVTGHKSNPDLDITNYRAQIPCDLVHLVAVAVDGYAAIPANNSFHQLLDGKCCGVDDFGSLLTDGTFVDNFGNTFLTTFGTKYGSAPLTYELNNNWITLSVPIGKVCLAYLAFPTDCDGFPMIPDDVSYREAVKRFLMMKIDYLKWRQNPSDSGFKALYEHSEQQWNWYCGQAMNKAKLPDYGRMENIKNMLLKLKPNVKAFNNFFTSVGVQESRKLL
jgi:hypothetical protein